MANVVDNGCAVLEQVCKPSRIELERWGLPRVNLWLGPATDLALRTHTTQAGREAAARIISFSQSKGRWMTVSVQQLQEMMRKDLVQFKRVADKHWQRSAQQEYYDGNIGRYWCICLLTLGLAALVMKRPKPPKQEDDEAPEELPKTNIRMGGISFIMDVGIRALVQEEYLYEERSEHVPVWYLPTEKLIRKILMDQEQVVVTPSPASSHAPLVSASKKK